MNKNKIVGISILLLVILGIAMIYFGGFYAPKLMIPPILTGIGFLIIAWAFNALKNNLRFKK